MPSGPPDFTPDLLPGPPQAGWQGGWGWLMGMGGRARYAAFLDTSLAEGWGGRGSGADRLDRERLIAGAGGLLSKGPCSGFVAGALQGAFLIANRVSSADQLDPFYREIYSGISETTVQQQMSTAIYVDASSPTPDQTPGQIVYAQANYSVDGNGTNVIDFFNAFFSLDSAARNQTVIHEAMHLFYNLSDQDFAKAVGAYKGDDTASEDWHAKLKEKCK